ncbi:MAG: hypothetical protein ACJ76Y_14020 [Thermoanaerobaculia bacterium]
MTPKVRGWFTRKPTRARVPRSWSSASRAFSSEQVVHEQRDAPAVEAHAKLAELKLAQAERCPKALGTLIKASEVQFHHEVTNQFLWSQL